MNLLYEIWYSSQYPLTGICFLAPKRRRKNDVPKTLPSCMIIETPDGWCEFATGGKPIRFTGKKESEDLAKQLYSYVREVRY